MSLWSDIKNNLANSGFVSILYTIGSATVSSPILIVP